VYKLKKIKIISPPPLSSPLKGEKMRRANPSVKGDELIYGLPPIIRTLS
jgi:hypothetical protein